ncbi:hypothetical protein K523DRAFT_358430 [Schizophyllum commune Tattone D]|nr:hypothetical protein K523DRAFT_358430 [Schizophyllum commune Tattone D]
MWLTKLIGECKASDEPATTALFGSPGVLGDGPFSTFEASGLNGLANAYAADFREGSWALQGDQFDASMQGFTYEGDIGWPEDIDVQGGAELDRDEPSRASALDESSVVANGSTSSSSSEPSQDIFLLNCLTEDAFADVAVTFNHARSALSEGLGQLGAGHQAVEQMQIFNKLFGPTAAALVSNQTDDKVDLSADGVRKVIEATETLKRVDQHLAISEADTFIYRQSVILAYLMFEHWLRSLVFQITLNGPLPANALTWYGRLFSRAVSAVDNPGTLTDAAGCIAFVPADDLAIPRDRTYNVQVGEVASYRPPQESKGRSTHIRTLISEVIYYWFTGSLSTQEQSARYDICALLIQHYQTPNVLLLPGVWDVWEHPTSWRTKRPHRRRQTFGPWDLRYLLRAISSLPPCPPGLHELGDEFEAYEYERRSEYAGKRSGGRRAGKGKQKARSAHSGSDASHSDSMELDQPADQITTGRTYNGWLRKDGFVATHCSYICQGPS